jgi:SAM-dependent methyltransferase
MLDHGHAVEAIHERLLYTPRPVAARPTTTAVPDPASAGECPCCGANLDLTPVLEGPDRLHGTPGSFPVARCAACGAGVTLPRLPPEALAAFYPDSYGPYDAAQRGAVARVSALIQAWQGWRALRTEPLRTLRARAASRAIDVGCGRGDLGAVLIRHGWRVTGVDPSATACEAARARGLDARHGTLASVSLEPGAHDAAIFRQSLEHVGDPVADLRRARECLRPGGLVLVSVPNFACWQRRRFASRWYHLDLPRHRVHFTPIALCAALRHAGLEPRRVSTSTSAVGLAATIQYALLGRCLFPGGLGLRVAAGLCSLTQPAAAAANALGRGGDLLHAAAVRPG